MYPYVTWYLQTNRKNNWHTNFTFRVKYVKILKCNMDKKKNTQMSKLIVFSFYELMKNLHQAEYLFVKRLLCATDTFCYSLQN